MSEDTPDNKKKPFAMRGAFHITVDEFDRFLAAVAGGCAKCGGPLQAVGTMGMVQNDEGKWVPEKPERALMTRISGDELLGLGWYEMTGIAALPATCDRCGRIEMFSIGHVWDFLPGGDNEG